MKAYSGYTAQKDTSFERLPDLPAGVYVAKIISAKEENDQYGDIIALAVEVVEGEYKGYYKRLYDSRSGGQYEAKYKGSIRLRIPTGFEDDSTMWRRRSFESNIWAIEDSNNGYRFDWTCKSLIGKLVGINVREREWEMNGNTGITTEIARLESVVDVRSGAAKPLKRRALKKPAVTLAETAAAAALTPAEPDEEFPF